MMKKMAEEGQFCAKMSFLPNATNDMIWLNDILLLLHQSFSILGQ